MNCETVRVTGVIQKLRATGQEAMTCADLCSFWDLRRTGTRLGASSLSFAKEACEKGLLGTRILLTLVGKRPRITGFRIATGRH